MLLPYQQAWVKDAAPLKIYLKARQIGFSFAETLAEVLECLERARTVWLLLSRGERQALELARKAKEHCQSIGAVATLYENEFIREMSIAQHRLEFPNGSVMIALPANPDTARGYAANVLLDEFAFHRDARSIFAAVYPSITRGLKLRIGSTPFGESGMFYELWTGQNTFSKHRTDIFEAQQQGLATDVETLRAGCPDEDIWRQEYCCEFISDATSWIPWELIIAAQSVDATVAPVSPPAMRIPPKAGPLQQADFFLGVDIGRRRDLTVIYVVEQIGPAPCGMLHTRAIQRLAHASFAEQQAAIENLLVGERSALPYQGVRRAAIDSTGLGAMLAETLQQKYGSRVEPVTFTLAVKEDLAVRVKRLFEERRIRILDDRELRSAIHAVRKYTTAAGHFRFDAERTERGHADEFWALALAAYAADAGPAAALGGFDPEPTRRTRTQIWVGEGLPAQAGSALPHVSQELREPGGLPYQAQSVTAEDSQNQRRGFFGPRGRLFPSPERGAEHER